jgi:uncharacterized membrane protein
MTQVEPTPAYPTPAAPPPGAQRPGFHVPTWAAVVVTVLVLAAIGFGIGYAVSDHHDHARVGPFGGRVGGGHPGVRLLGFLFVLAVVALVVVGVVAAVRSLSHRPLHDGAVGPPSLRGSSPTAAAEQILAERLARGEIDADEYRTRLDALRR